MLSLTIKQLLEAGVHFGHQTQHWHPRMKSYIFSQRNGIHVIDLQKTLKKFKETYDFVKELTARGGEVLFVGTKKQAQEIIKEEAIRSKSPYVNYRWLGGMLTNFRTIRKNLERLKKLEDMEKEGLFEVLPHGEVKDLKKEKEKLNLLLGGVREMEDLPDAIFVVDLKKEQIAIAEAKKIGIPVVGVVDTDCDPDLVDYCIPGNDDAIRGIKLFTNQIAEAAIEGKGLYSKAEGEEISAAQEETPEEKQAGEESVKEEPIQEESLPETQMPATDEDKEGVSEDGGEN